MAQAATNESAKTVIELKHPISFKGEQITQLEMRRPKVRDNLTAAKRPGSEAEKELFVFANLCEQDPAMLEELDMVDYLQLQSIYTGFLE
jgi:hypothetical protein